MIFDRTLQVLGLPRLIYNEILILSRFKEYQSDPTSPAPLREGLRIPVFPAAVEEIVTEPAASDPTNDAGLPNS